MSCCCCLLALAAIAGAASPALAGGPAAVPAYMPYPDALHLPYTDWEVPYDTMMPLTAGTVPYAAPLPPLACPAATPAVAETADPAGATRYPRAVLERPAVMPLGIVVGSAELLAVPSSSAHPAHLAAVPGLAAGLPAGSDLLVWHQQPLGGDGSPSLLSASTGLSLHRGSWLSISSRSTITYDAGAGHWAASTSGLRIAAMAGPVGVWLRPEQLRLDLGGDADPALVLALAAGVQLTPTVWAQLDGDVHLADLEDWRLVRRPREPLPMGLAAVVSLAPRLDLRTRVGGDVGSDGVVSTSLTWMMGLAYIVGG